MSGTQPSKPSNIIAREFRGVRLYLKSVHAGRGMRWLADKTKAAKFLMPEALTICERASGEWGTQCAVLDNAGNLAHRYLIRALPGAGDDATGARMRQDVRDRLSKLIKDIRELRSQIREI